MGDHGKVTVKKITSVLFIIYRLMKSNKAAIDEVAMDNHRGRKALRF